MTRQASPRIIGSLSGQPELTTSVLMSLLSLPAAQLSHGSAFTGKTVTRIQASEDWVLKRNEQRQFQDQQTADAWCRKRIAQEAAYGIYHPRRTWVVIAGADGQWFASNASPRLQPLHQLDWDACENPLHLIGQVIAMYCRFSSCFEKRLDEGLSNFGLENGTVWYLDDDLYDWDEHASFVAMLSRWLRVHCGGWFSVGIARELGSMLHGELLKHRTSLDVEIVAYSIRDQFVGKAAGPARDALITAMLKPAVQPVAAEPGLWQREPGRMDWSRPFAVLADIHANLPALQAVLEWLDARSIGEMLILGDIVGYGPYPAECIALLRQRHALCIRGNHDHFVAHERESKVPMSQSAQLAADWTMRHLSEDELWWLRELPLKLEVADILAVHGAPCDRTFMNGYVYEMTYERNLRCLRDSGVHICFHGHTHVQGVYASDGRRDFPLCCDATQALSGYAQCLVSPGSVGQPRTGKPGADFAIFYPSDRHIEFLSVQYEAGPMLKHMRSLRFPDSLITRLIEAR